MIRRVGLLGALLACLTFLPATARADSTLYVGSAADGCPNAQFTDIATAVSYAQPHDTIRICPGTYTVGPAAGTTITGEGLQGLVIDKTLTIIGAGASKVIIEPSTDLASGTSAVDNFRDPYGNVVTVEQIPANDPGDSSDFDVNVLISGVTITNAGHLVDAGVVFDNAAGTISSSTVTPYTGFSTAPTTSTPNYGWGVEATNNYAVTPQGAFNRDVTVSGDLIRSYGGGGVLVDGSEACGPCTVSGYTAKPIYFRSGVAEAAAITNNVITGSASAAMAQQYGIQVNAGARATITGNAITGNLGSTAGSATSPGTGVGILMTDADVTTLTPGSTTSYLTKVSGNGLTGNGYGIFNGTADFPGAPASDANHTYPIDVNGTGTTPANLPASLTNTTQSTPAAPVTVSYRVPGVTLPAGSNNYGSAGGVVGGPSTATSDGISESSSGASDSVLYSATASFTAPTAPTAVTDAAPTAAWGTPDGVNQATLVGGRTIDLEAIATDDFGVKSVDITADGIDLGTLTAPPYEVAWTPAATLDGQTVPLVATVTDSSGQVTTATINVAIIAPPPASTTTATTPTTMVSSPAPASSPTPAAGATATPAPTTAPAAVGAPKVAVSPGLGSASTPLTALTLTPVLTGDITKVVYTLNGKVICTATQAPYRCTSVVTPAEVGTDKLVITATGPGGTTTITRTIHVSTFLLQFKKARFTVKGLRGLVQLRQRTSAWLNANHEVQGYVGVTAPGGASHVNRQFTVSIYVGDTLAARGKVNVPDGHTKLFSLRVSKRLTFAKGTKVTAVIGALATFAPKLKVTAASTIS